MKRAILIVTILFIAVISTACINNFAVQELNNKAQTYLNNGDYESAIDRLEASIDLDSTIYETHYNLGVACIKSEKYDKAIKALTKAIELNPNQGDSYYSLAVAQEAYADEILDLNEKNSVQKETEDVDDDSNKMDLTQFKKMDVNQRKVAAMELYTSSLTSYKKYLELTPDAKDAEDVNNQIKSIEEELAELGKES